EAARLDDAPHQGKAVGMHAARGEAEHDVAGCDLAPGDEAVALDGADREAGEVVIAGAVQARHLGRLAADEGAARYGAGLGDARDDGAPDLHLEPAGGVVIEEEQGLGTL